MIFLGNIFILFIIEKVLEGCYSIVKPVEYKINGNNFNQINIDSDNKEKNYGDDG